MILRQIETLFPTMPCSQCGQSGHNVRTCQEYSIDMKAPRNTKDYNPPIKWLMSEKLDGYRARFNPETKSFRFGT